VPWEKNIKSGSIHAIFGALFAQKWPVLGQSEQK
jgi:hypothetical protein